MSSYQKETKAITKSTVCVYHCSFTSHIVVRAIVCECPIYPNKRGWGRQTGLCNFCSIFSKRIFRNSSVHPFFLPPSRFGRILFANHPQKNVNRKQCEKGKWSTERQRQLERQKEREWDMEIKKISLHKCYMTCGIRYRLVYLKHIEIVSPPFHFHFISFFCVF